MRLWHLSNNKGQARPRHGRCAIQTGWGYQATYIHSGHAVDVEAVDLAAREAHNKALQLLGVHREVGGFDVQLAIATEAEHILAEGIHTRSVGRAAASARVCVVFWWKGGGQELKDAPTSNSVFQETELACGSW